MEQEEETNENKEPKSQDRRNLICDWNAIDFEVPSWVY